MSHKNVVQWIDFAERVIAQESFPPYAGTGFSSFVRAGLEQGHTVTYEGRIIESIDEYGRINES